MTGIRTDPLTDDEWTCFERDGYLRLGRTLPVEELAGLQQRIDEIMLGTVRDEGLMMQLDHGGAYEEMDPQTLGFKGPRLDYRKIEKLERDARFLAFLQKPLFAGICARAYGAGTAISVYRSMFMNKPARQGTLLPWHQDGGRIFGLDRDPLIAVWTALDPSTIANGCVQIIPGSHRLGLLTGFRLRPEQIAEHCRPERALHLELGAGESALLHNWTMHTSDVNRTAIPRRAFSVSYLEAGTRRADGSAFPVVFGDGALAPSAQAVQGA